MINPFVIKKWGAFLLTGLLTVIFFFVGLNFFGFLIGLALMGVGLFIGALLANKLIDNPFRMMLEGKGVLAMNLDSTGIIRFFIMTVKSPYIEGKIGHKLVTDIFDREAVYNLAAPVKAGMVQKGKGKDGVVRLAFVLEEEEYNKARFGLFHYPLIIYNEQLNTVLTKDWFSEKEKSGFAEHQVLYLNRKMEELTSSIRDFGRYIVESLKPKSFTIKPIWITIIIIVFVIILLVMFAPKLIPALAGAGAGVVDSVKSASGAITPR